MFSLNVLNNYCF